MDAKGQTMKTQFQYIRFEMVERKAVTGVWQCVNNKSGDVLGLVKWYPGWRQYCFFCDTGIVLSAGCLHDIESFIVEAHHDFMNRKVKAS